MVHRGGAQGVGEKGPAITDRGYRVLGSLDSLLSGCTESDPCYNPDMNQQDFTKPQGSQHNFQMIQNDGTHTGLSSRFEEEVAAERERLEAKRPGNAVSTDRD